jgi:hypothetical protein
MRYRFPAMLADLPIVMQLGLLLLVCGGMLDMLYHAGWAPLLAAHLGHNGAIAHLVTLSGMVVMLLGVFARPRGGLRPRRQQ